MKDKSVFFQTLIGFVAGTAITIAAVFSLNYFTQPDNQVLQGNQDVNIDKNIELNVDSAITSAVEKAEKSVVGIVSLLNEKEIGSGSGVIYKKEGNKAFIVTNNHVVSGADGVEVAFSDGTRENAKVLGTDIYTDLAVLEISAGDNIVAADFGSSEDLKTGEFVIAIGSPLGLEFYGTVTLGVISSKERNVPVDLSGNGSADWEVTVMQTDAAINPGNSGGALINIEGKVVGINSMKIAQNTVEGIAFSIPTSVVIPIVEQLETTGEVSRPKVGVVLRSLSEVPLAYRQYKLNLPDNQSQGVLVSQVEPGSPADRAGIVVDDLIVEFDGKKIVDSVEFRKELYARKKGDTINLKIVRDRKQVDIKVELTDQSY